jgi:hypothetical protein
MNQADILKLAESSGLITSQHGGICTRMTREYITPELTRFAELVAQHEKEQLEKKLAMHEAREEWIYDNASVYGGGHGFTVTFDVMVDHEDIFCGIDEAIRAGGAK